MMLSLYYCIWLVVISTVSGVYYDTYTGEVVSDDVYLQHVAANTTFWCIHEADECDPDEWRRIGGGCNNLNDPARGASHTPFTRVLPRVFQEGTTDGPRLAVSGGELPTARKLRTQILATGTVPSLKFTNLASHFLVAAADETNSLHDSVNNLFNYDCCDENLGEWMCLEHTIPEDDPVFKFTKETCLNATRLLTYQMQGCTVADTTDPIRINSEPPLYDLSNVYGGPEHVNLTRLGTGGLIPYEDLDGYDWPRQSPIADLMCVINRPELNETRCHDSVGQLSGNSFVGLNLHLMWYLRNHNRIARALSELNPCWDDEQLYFTARDINIASYQQVLFYGLYSDVLGRDNLVNAGVLSESESFRDIYDDSLMPAESEEYFFAQRWYHTMVQGDLKMYDRQGEEIGSIILTELTLRTGWYAVDDHIAQLTQGAFRQATGSMTDHIIDPEIADDVFRNFQVHADPEANGLLRGRYLGLAPYVDYVCHYDNKTIETWEDLEPHIDSQLLQILENNYDNVRDIDLSAGLWAENHISGGHVPETLYWLSAEYLRDIIAADRHWYERPNRPHAFTEAQLGEIRKSTVSDLLCHVAEGVTEIQPNSFQIISETNPLTSCDEITAAASIDFSAWKDTSCAV